MMFGKLDRGLYFFIMMMAILMVLGIVASIINPQPKPTCPQDYFLMRGVNHQYFCSPGIPAR